MEVERIGAIEKANALHERGFNCAQSVLASCSDYTGLDEEGALGVSCGFGGGMRCGEICGAVSGGVMALGLAYPFRQEGDIPAKERINALVEEYTEAFRIRFGHLRCQELAGDKSVCPRYIAYAAELAETMIQNNQEEERG